MPTDRYPLEVESIGSDTYIIISRGHHNIHAFMRAVRAEGYEWPLGVPTHIWMKTRPAAKGSGYLCFYDPVPQGTRGAWPATHVSEAWGDSSYEAKHPAAADALATEKAQHHG